MRRKDRKTFVHTQRHSASLHDKRIVTNDSDDEDDDDEVEITIYGINDSRFRLDRLELRHVVAGDVALLPGAFTPREPPVALRVVEYLQVLALPEAQVLVGASVVLVERDEYLGGRDVRVRDLRHRPDGVRRWGRHRTRLGRDRLDTGVAYSFRLLLLHVCGVAEAVAHVVAVRVSSASSGKVCRIRRLRHVRRRRQASSLFRRSPRSHLIHNRTLSAAEDPSGMSSGESVARDRKQIVHAHCRAFTERRVDRSFTNSPHVRHSQDRAIGVPRRARNAWEGKRDGKRHRERERQICQLCRADGGSTSDRETGGTVDWITREEASGREERITSAREGQQQRNHRAGSPRILRIS